LCYSKRRTREWKEEKVKSNKTYRDKKGRSISTPPSSETIREQKFQNSSTVHEHGKAAVIGEGVNF
jgi:hypothetical protein